MVKKIIRRSSKGNNPKKEASKEVVKSVPTAIEKVPVATEKKPKKKKKPPKSPAVIKKQGIFLKALFKNRCSISASCEALNIGRSTVYTWLANDSEFAKDVDNVREALLDLVEDKILQLIVGIEVEYYDKASGNRMVYKMPPNGRMAVEFMKAKGKHRGWTPRTEITGADGLTLGNKPIAEDMTAEEATLIYLENMKG